MPTTTKLLGASCTSDQTVPDILQKSFRREPWGALGGPWAAQGSYGSKLLHVNFTGTSRDFTKYFQDLKRCSLWWTPGNSRRPKSQKSVLEFIAVVTFFTETFTVTSRTFTNTCFLCNLHGNLHGIFTVLHEHSVFRSAPLSLHGNLHGIFMVLHEYSVFQNLPF